MLTFVEAILFSTVIAVSPVDGLKRPGLTIPQGMVESRLNPKAVGARNEKGAWQVLEKEFGRVPKSLKGQAIQHERILDELIQENKGDIGKAVMRYNSFKNIKAGQRYLAKVRKRSIEYHLIA